MMIPTTQYASNVFSIEEKKGGHWGNGEGSCLAGDFMVHICTGASGTRAWRSQGTWLGPVEGRLVVGVSGASESWGNRYRPH